MDRGHRADLDMPGAQGPLAWFICPNEVMEIRMTSAEMEYCVRAAETLNARYFVTRCKLGIGLGDGWGVFDIKNKDPAGSTQLRILLQDGKYIRPLKVFDTPDTDAPIMWALTVGAMR